MLKKTQFHQAMSSPTMWVIFFLAIASGLPLPLVSGTLTAWYTQAGVSLSAIGALSLIQLPYLLKPLWAPLLDRYTPIHVGRRRAWLIVSQGCIALALVAMSLFNAQKSPAWLAYLGLITAFFSATQDIAFDAYRTDLLMPNERGLGSAMTSIGYRLALIISGALALIAAASVGWRLCYQLMALMMIAFMCISAYSPIIEQDTPAKSLQEALVQPLVSFLKQPHAYAILGFIMTYKLSDAFALSLSTTFLMRGLGFSLATIGSVMKTVSLSASVIGALAGGTLMLRLSLYRALFVFAILQAVSNIGYWLLAYIGHSLPLMITAVSIEYFCGALASVAFIAYLMSLCDKQYTAMQYALFSSIASVGRVLIGPLAAEVAAKWGWLNYFSISIMLGIPPLIYLWWMRQRLLLFRE